MNLLARRRHPPSPSKVRKVFDRRALGSDFRYGTDTGADAGVQKGRTGAGVFVKLAGFGETEKVEGFGWLEVFYGVAGEDVSLIGAEIEFHDLTGLVVEVDLFEVNPEGVGGKGRLEKVEETFVVGDGAPAGGGDVGLLGGGKAVGYGDVADEAEDTGERNDGIL